MAVSDAFNGGVVGFWYDAYPVSNFQTVSSGGTDLSAYSTRAAFNAFFGLWKDLSGNVNNATQSGYNLGSALNDPAGSWKYAGNMYADMQASVGGSSSAFYWAAAFAVGSYYGTLFSDQSSPTSTNGFRIYHNAGGNGTNPLFGFCANGKAYNGTTAEGDPTVNTSVNISVPTGGSLYANGSFTNINVLECWYDGSNLFMRKNRGPVIQSLATIAVAAGSTTAYINSNVGSDNGSGGQDIYAMFMTKNNVPSTSVRDQIYDYLVNRSTSGGSRLLTGQSVTMSIGTMTAPTQGVVALSGQGTTLGRGFMTPATVMAPSGQAVTSASGTMAPNISVQLTGQNMAVSIGVVTAALTLQLAGLQLSANQGDVSPPGAVQVALQGTSMTVSRGAMITGPTAALTGLAVAMNKGTLAPANQQTLAGQGMTAAAGATAPFNAGWQQTTTTATTWVSTSTTQNASWTATTTTPATPGWTKTST